VELSVTAGGAVRVHPVICTVDCGMLVNPDAVVAQMESGIVFGLTAALYGEITLDNGRVQQSRFHDYPLLRMTEMPVIDVHILPSVRPLAEWESLVRRPLRRQ
jgi:isoquinoline 1-oxidoreductase beta subunit